MSERISALRGAALSFTADPLLDDVAECMAYLPDAVIVVREGLIADFGPAVEVLPRIPAGVPLTRYDDALILPGFIDAHVHYGQTPIIGAYGEQLIDWLHRYAFVAEAAFGDPRHATTVARLFLRQCLVHGTTTAAVFCTVHPESVEAFFEESAALSMRNIAGKVLMDRNAPEGLCDTPQRGYDESAALIARWHGRDRQLYAVTPRFAPTSSPEQLELAGALWHEHPGTYLQTHVSENRGELAWVAELFPERRGYLDVYDHHGLLGPRAILGHGIHLDEAELQRCHDTGTAIAHCPTSNLFLGSGLFDLAAAARAERPLRLALATDIGAGTSFSMLATMAAAYQVAQLGGRPLSAAAAFYLATRGAARALRLEDRIGSLAVGLEADLVVLDLRATPLLEYRLGLCADLQEKLFVLLTLGDDRTVAATWVDGEEVHRRAPPGEVDR